MYRWIRTYDAHPSHVRTNDAGAIFETVEQIEAFGPEHPDHAVAVAWLRANVGENVGAFRLAGPPVRARVTVVLDGLDDAPASPASPLHPATPPAAVAEEKTRRPRTPKETATVNAGPYHCVTCGAAPGSPHKPGCKSATPAPAPVPVEAVASADDSPAPTVAETLEATPAPAAVEPPPAPVAPPAPAVRLVPPPTVTEPVADVAAAIGATAPTGPRVELAGNIVEVFDGAAWFWQRFQTATTAERTARKANDAIESDSTGMALRGILVMLRPGRAPADAATPTP